MHTNLIVDLSNIVWNNRHRQKTEEFSKALLIHDVVMMIIDYAKKFDVDGVLLAYDSKDVWRKDVYPEYKENRKDNRDVFYSEVIETMEELREFFTTCTNIPVISAERAEADDIIAVTVQTINTNFIILSSDKDFIQLTDERVKLYSPAQKTFRNTTDREFDLFVKIIRGDRQKDNTISAYPKVRLTKLEKAWSDPVEMVNMMETRTKEGYLVKDQFEINAELMDLTMQPQHIRDAIVLELSNINTAGNYSHIRALKFFGKYELKRLADLINKNAGVLKKQFATTKENLCAKSPSMVTKSLYSCSQKEM